MDGKVIPPHNPRARKFVTKYVRPHPTAVAILILRYVTDKSYGFCLARSVTIW